MGSSLFLFAGATHQMARSVFSTRAEYFLRVDGKVFGILFQTLEEAEEMARAFIAKGAIKVVIVRHGRGLIVKRFGSAESDAEESEACCPRDEAP
jgi:hypothetical protein